MPTSLFSFFLLLLLASSAAGQMPQAPCNTDDKKALLAFLTNFDNPSSLAETWIPATDCCSWSGVGCNATSGRVTDVNIVNIRNVSGTISPAIGDLPYLLNLRLVRLSNLVGTIPSTIVNLDQLVWLDLSHNSLSGTIPSFISELASVTYLDLSHNKFSGFIPPSLYKLGDTLGALVLSHNKLTGQIPDSFGKFPKFPGTLFLDHNRLTGPIPRSLGRPEWPFINLSHNKLTGDASFLFGAGRATTILYLQENQLSFDLSGVTFPVNLSEFGLNNNYVYGSIPAQINQVTGLGLEKFNVSYNLLCGEIPQGPVTAKFDKYAYSNNKCLCGAPLPPCSK